MSGIRFKVACEAHEFEQIHRLNYRTFVEEIPQHAANGAGVLVDGRTERSTFFIALRDTRLAGMIAVSDQRPFSLDARLPQLDTFLPAALSPCEIRLLAVEPGERSGPVFRGLAEQLARYCLQRGHDLAIISGTTRQRRLYAHLGFIPFGPLVGTEAAAYQPMYMTLEALRALERPLLDRDGGSVSKARPAYFMPGPVQPCADVAAAMEQSAQSHRADAFAATAARVNTRLQSLTGAHHVVSMLGSGTLANDAVAAQLRRAGPGIVLSHGEFGERLADHAQRWGLRHHVVRRPWGGTFTGDDIDAALDAQPGVRWLWFVLCETSTGVVTDLHTVRELCASRGVLVCVDAISALGTMPVDLGDVHLASGVGTKGLGAPPGIALVFHRDGIASSPDVPRYLDLGAYHAAAGTPYTHSSNLLAALDVALRRFDDAAAVFRTTAADGAWLRRAVRRAGLGIVAPESAASPAVITIDLGSTARAAAVAMSIEARGYHIGWRSGYLQRRGWLQFALMGAYRRDCMAGLTAALEHAVAR